jgi:hypothetical protein
MKIRLAMPLLPDSLIVPGGSPEVFRTICVCIYVFGRAFTWQKSGRLFYVCLEASEAWKGTKDM